MYLCSPRIYKLYLVFGPNPSCLCCTGSLWDIVISIHLHIIYGYLFFGEYWVGFVSEFPHSAGVLPKLTTNQGIRHTQHNMHTLHSRSWRLMGTCSTCLARWELSDRQDAEVTEPQEWSDSFLAMAWVSQAEVAKAHRPHAHELTTRPGSTS